MNAREVTFPSYFLPDTNHGVVGAWDQEKGSVLTILKDVQETEEHLCFKSFTVIGTRNMLHQLLCTHTNKPIEIYKVIFLNTMPNTRKALEQNSIALAD